MQSKRFWSWTRQNGTKFVDNQKFVFKKTFVIYRQTWLKVWTNVGLKFIFVWSTSKSGNLGLVNGRRRKANITVCCYIAVSLIWLCLFWVLKSWLSLSSLFMLSVVMLSALTLGVLLLSVLMQSRLRQIYLCWALLCWGSLYNAEWRYNEFCYSASTCTMTLWYAVSICWVNDECHCAESRGTLWRSPR